LSRTAAILDAVAKVAVALGSVAIVAVLLYAAQPLLGNRAAYVPFVLAVAISAWYGGLVPGLLATITGGLAAVWLARPLGSFSIAAPADELAIAIYLVAGIMVAVLAAGLRNGRDRAESARAAAEKHAARASRLEAVATAVGRELRPREAAEAVLREGLAALGAGSGVVGILEDDEATITVVSGFGYTEETLDKFRHFPLDAPFPLSEAVRLREPIVLDRTEDIQARYPTLRETVASQGTALVLPLIYEERAVGGLYFRFRDHRKFDRDDLGYLMALGRQCAAALQRARLYETEFAARQSAQQAAERLVFLAHASEVLGASLDYETTVQGIARLAVPQIADWCTVHVMEPDGTFRVLALEHMDPSKVELASRYVGLAPPTLADEHGAGAVIRTGVTEHIDWITDEMLEAGARDQDQRELLLAIAPRSALVVPLTVRDRTFGALTLASAETQRRFDDRDRTLAEDLAHRAATAIDNARLFQEREATSRELRGRVGQQEAVVRLGQQALVDEDLDRLFGATLEEVRTVLDAELASLFELDTMAGTLRMIAASGWHDEAVGSSIRAGRGQPGEPLLSAEPVVVDESSGDRVVGAIPLLVDAGVVAHASLAIRAGAGSAPWGVLAVHSRRPRGFDPDDVTFLRAVVNVLAGAIDRARKLEIERRSQDVGRAFIGVVSHELRTPITSIYAGAKLLNRRVGNEDERAEIAADIEAEADRLYRLTEDLLVLTRLERHDLELGREPILLTHLLHRVVASEQRRWPLVTFEPRVEGRLATVMGEESYVEQVVHNLLGNAAKYSPTGSHVEVVAEDLDGGVAVRVLDRGPGIGGSDPAQLFALFYRAPGTASQASGAGIGLFVCDQLVRAMGGTLWARPRPGGGSEFGFSLARYPDELDGTDGARPVATGPGRPAPDAAPGVESSSPAA
jgi:signal transduction histidine kinase